MRGGAGKGRGRRRCRGDTVEGRRLGRRGGVGAAPVVDDKDRGGSSGDDGG